MGRGHVPRWEPQKPGTRSWFCWNLTVHTHISCHMADLQASEFILHTTHRVPMICCEPSWNVRGIGISEYVVPYTMAGTSSIKLWLVEMGATRNEGWPTTGSDARQNSHKLYATILTSAVDGWSCQWF